jgi:uncharacterized protein YcfL
MLKITKFKEASTMGKYAVTAMSVLVMLAFLAACSTNSGPSSSPQTTPVGTVGTQYPSPEPVVVSDYQKEAVDDSYPGVKRVIASDYLLDSIQVVDPKIGTKGNFSRAQVTVKNLTQDRYELEYQYQWEDQDGFAVGSPRPWNRFALGPKEFKKISEMALQQDAKQAIFTVRMVDDSLLKENYQPDTNQYNQPGVDPGKPSYNN